MNLCVLASGSKGNSTYITGNDTNILIDAGINAKTISTRLESINVNPGTIDAVIISHEHGDHTDGVKVFCKKYNIPVYVTYQTFRSIRHDWSDLNIVNFEHGKSFKIKSLTIKPFYVSHDAYSTSAFVVKNGDKSIGIATDLGDFSQLLIQNFKSCTALVLESNYEDELLMRSTYPWNIKKRIRGQRGHLSNKRSFELIKKISEFNVLQNVLLAHISQENNSEEHILKHLKSFPNKHVKILLTAQDNISEIIDI
ncbi:MAG: MBL fold metallo-hydrolase [bacterium]|nr:MBL fold metallo-hydrolase [bacterium]